MFKKLKQSFIPPVSRNLAPSRSAPPASPNKCQNLAALSRLPYELLEAVISHLDLADRACLALTCHALYNELSPGVWQPVSTNRRARYTFLVTALDHRYPSHQLCFHCAKFHKGANEVRQRYAAAPSSDWANPGRAVIPPHPCPEHARHPTSTTFPPELTLFDSTQGHIPWWLIQQIMRAHRHSPKHGLSAGVLNRTDKKSSGRIAACVNGSKAKIVGGRLLVRVSTVQAVDLKAGATVRFDEVVRQTATCGHFYRLPALSRACSAAVAEFRNREARREGVSPVYRCPHCPSEVQVSVKRAGDHELSSARHTYGGSAPGYVIVVERYLDLGKGVFPDDLEWSSLTGCAQAGTCKSGNGVAGMNEQLEAEAHGSAHIKARFHGIGPGEEGEMLRFGQDDRNDALALNAMMQLVQT